MKILFMCVANSARSQIAEGLAKSVFGKDVWIESAGSSPKGVNPYAARILDEIGISITGHHSKLYEQLPPSFLVDLGYIITLCAEEVCPVMASKTAKRLHWPLPDPASNEPLSDQEFMKRFRAAREDIFGRLQTFKKEIEG